MRLLWTLLLLLLVAGVAFWPRLFTSTPPADDHLVLLSPHWDGIREEFGRAFETHWQSQTGRHVSVEWWDVGGAGEIRRYIKERAKQARWDEGEGIGVDVLFGGGVFDFVSFSKDGLLEAYNPPPETRQAIPDQVNGQALRDPQRRWQAACLSGFGIVYNRLVIEKTGLPAPLTWADLARPEYLGWVSCGDPTKSGSLHMAFEIVLQAHGWEDGWGILTHMAANVRAFNEGGGSIPRDVSLGQAAAGPCIDFYAAAPVRRQGATHLEFVFPKGLSVVTPDAIAILRNAPHKEVARAFLDFVLSEEGQRIWYQKRDTPGGPQRFDLERLPVRPALYEAQLPTYTVARPFSEGNAFAYDEKKGGKRWGLLESLFRATLMDVHEDLKEAWEAVIAAGRVGDLGKALGRAPLNETELFALAAGKRSPAEDNQLRRRWTGWARSRYQAIRAAAESGGAVPQN